MAGAGVEPAVPEGGWVTATVRAVRTLPCWAASGGVEPLPLSDRRVSKPVPDRSDFTRQAGEPPDGRPHQCGVARTECSLPTGEGGQGRDFYPWRRRQDWHTG